MLFGVPDEIPDITRSSGMVRRIRFIYRKSYSKFGNDPVHLWKVLEGSRKDRKKSLWKAESRMRSRTSRGVPEWSGGKDLYIGSPVSAIGTSFGVIGIVPGPPEGSRGPTGWGHLPRGATWAVGGAPWPTWAKGTSPKRPMRLGFPPRRSPSGGRHP